MWHKHFSNIFCWQILHLLLLLLLVLHSGTRSYQAAANKAQNWIMLRHKRNIKAKAKTTEHVKLKLPGITDALHPQASTAFKERDSDTDTDSVTDSVTDFIIPVQALQLRLEYNQHLNQRVTLCLELYHKNIIKKLTELNKINVYKLTKNVCQT